MKDRKGEEGAGNAPTSRQIGGRGGLVRVPSQKKGEHGRNVRSDEDGSKNVAERGKTEVVGNRNTRSGVKPSLGLMFLSNLLLKHFDVKMSVAS